MSKAPSRIADVRDGEYCRWYVVIPTKPCPFLEIVRLSEFVGLHHPNALRPNGKRRRQYKIIVRLGNHAEYGKASAYDAPYRYTRLHTEVFPTLQRANTCLNEWLRPDKLRGIILERLLV